MKKVITSTAEQKRKASSGVLQQAQKAVDEGMAVYESILEILWNDWDPIGVRPVCPAARDEYEDYVPEFFLLKLKNAGVDQIAEALHGLEKQLTRREIDKERCRRVAEKIFKL